MSEEEELPKQKKNSATKPRQVSRGQTRNPKKPWRSEAEQQKRASSKPALQGGDLIAAQQQPAELDKPSQEQQPRRVDDDDDDDDRCIVCCETMTYCGLGECNHRACCGLCTFRLRTLHKDEKCVMCKQLLKRVFIVKPDDPRNYEDLRKLTWGKLGFGVVGDDKSDIYYSDDCLEFKSQMDSLRAFRCGECTETFPSIARTEKHLSEAHGKVLCKLCLEFRGLFFMEHQRMTPAELAAHSRTGDDVQSIEGHPACKFCRNTLFYNSDALYKHLNEAHESCHLCAKQGSKYQYFRDYKALEAHFFQAHFACDHPRCREAKFVAFLTDLQLQAHNANEHPERADEARANPLSLDFVYKGSRRANQMEEEISQLGRTPSPGASLVLDQEHFPRLGAAGVGGPVINLAAPSFRSQQGRSLMEEDFPRLGNSVSQRPLPPPSISNRRTVQDLNEDFRALKLLGSAGAEREVRLWCDKLAKRQVPVQDFSEYMINLLGPVTFNAVYEDIKRSVGSAAAQQLDEFRKPSGRERPTSASVAASTVSVSRPSSVIQPRVAPPVVLDERAFPTLSAAARPRQINRMSRAEVREAAFSTKAPQRQVTAPIGATPVWSGKHGKEDVVDDKLDLRTSASSGQHEKKQSKKKKEKSEREQVLEMALKFS